MHFQVHQSYCIFIQISPKLISNLRVQLTISQHWFRKWLGAEQVTSHCLTWAMMNLFTAACMHHQALLGALQATSHYLSQSWPRAMSPYDTTRPQWVKRAGCSHISYRLAVLSWEILNCIMFIDHLDGLVQEKRNSIANALELRLSCTNPLIYDTSHSCSSYVTYLLQDWIWLICWVETSGF